MNDIEKLTEQMDRIESKLDELLARKKKKTIPAGARDPEYSVDFENAWKTYPKRSGGNSKAQAYAQWNARLKEGIDAMVMTSGISRYAKHCEIQGTEPQFVKMTCTFLGRDKHFLETWDATPVVKKVALPMDMEGLARFAVTNNLHPLGSAPTSIRNAFEYRSWIQERMK